ncbi:arylamine N-acetyltransferase family protein [Pseudomonas quasicaspiana]|uniref:hypothetical protein n=1 Tax=Pseudomonas quasicaspiana TaxID=2829821 RepID=UPI001E50595B|nr:hypothetical protein [Pseudomonas quasicaspiana]MCD5971711.1 hypothetical protein [Pseudomonas quasicaspiana]
MDEKMHRVLQFVGLLIMCIVLIEHFSHDAQPRGRGETIPGVDHIQGLTLAEMPKSVFEKGNAEPDLSYVSRVTGMVHRATYHCSPTDNSVSWIEAVLNVIADKTGFDPMYEYGLFNFRTLKCGFCSERAAAVTRVLRENGMDATTYGIGGHVITRVMVGGKAYFTDPDYGVGPYPADLSFSDVINTYEYSVIPSNSELLARIVTKRSDDGPYLSERQITKLRDIRRWIHYVANGLAFGMIVCGLWLARAIATNSRLRLKVFQSPSVE